MNANSPEFKDRLALAATARALGLPGEFAGMSATAKLRTLTGLPDLPRTLRQLRPDEVFHLIRDIGVEDAFDLLAYATPAQRRAFVDLAAWSGRSLAPERLDRVLEMARDVSLDFALRYLDELGPEVIALRIFARADVLTQDEAETTPIADDVSFVTPDGVFVVVCASPDDVQPLRRLMDLLYAQGVEQAHVLLQGGRRDTPASIEDQVGRFRTARMEDLGFPPDEERFALFEPFDVAGLRERLARKDARRPAGAAAGESLALPLRGVGPDLFLWRAMTLAAAQEDVAGVTRELTLLVNRVFAASDADPQDTDAWQEASLRTVSLLSLGLEDLSGGNADIAADILRAAWPVELFRAGVETIRPAHLRARALIGRVGGLTGLRLFGEAMGEGLRVLASFPPKVGRPIGNTFAVREFSSLADVSWANRLAFTADALVRFATRDLGFRPDPAATKVGIVAPTFANVLATAWAHLVIAGAVSLEPLDSEALRSLKVAAFDGDRLRAGVRPTPEGLGLSQDRDEDREVLQAFLDDTLTRVEATLGTLDAGRPIDVRFVGDALLVR